MSKTIVALTTSTIVFAGTTLFLAWQLGELRNRQPGAATLRATNPQPAASPVAPDGAIADAGAGANSTRTAHPLSSLPSALPPNDPRAQRAQQLAKYGPSAREFMARYDDPESRGDLLEEEWEQRREHLRSARGKVDLGNDEWEAVIGFQAAASLDQRARSTRCFLDEKCETPAPEPRSLEEQREALIARIGRNKFDAVLAQEKRGAEAGVVVKFQERLPAELRLRPAESEALMDALGDELQAVLRDLRSRGIEPGVFSSWSALPFTPGAKDLDEQMLMAREATDRMRSRAATLLRGERMATFDILMDDGLLMFRAFSRQQISLHKLQS